MLLQFDVSIQNAISDKTPSKDFLPNLEKES